MAISLKGMSRKELEKLGARVEKAIEKLHQKDLRSLRAEMEKLAAAHGVSVEDVMAGKGSAKSAGKKGTKAKAKSAPKYANPDDASQTWTGRGRQPEWYKAAIEAGKTPESMAI